MEVGTEAEKHPYQMDATTRRFHKGIAISLLAIPAMGLPRLIRIMVSPLSRLAFVLVEVPLAAIQIRIWSLTDRRVILYENAIEVAGWLSTRELGREQILGRRMSTKTRYAYYIVVPIE